MTPPARLLLVSYSTALAVHLREVLAQDPVTVDRIGEAQAVSTALAGDGAPPDLVVVDGEHAEGATAITLVNAAARRPPVWILAEPTARVHTAAWPAHDGYLALSTPAWMLRAHLVGLLTERSVIGAVLPVRKLRVATREPDVPPTDARQRHEAARSASEERLRLIARASGDVVWDWDLRNDTIWWSENYADVFGHRYDRDAPSSLSWSQYIHPDDYARVMNDVEHAIAQGAERWSAYYRLRHVDGRYVRVHDRGYVVRDTDGRPVRMLGVISDVTRQVALEDQLRQMQRLEAIGRLTGGIAHDFNNLLTVILGNAEVLASDGDDERRTLAEMIASAALRGAELTARLLAFARKQALDPTVTDVVALLAGVEPLLRRTLGEQVDLRFVHDAAPRAALIDPGQLEDAVLNLCLNARDAMPGGGRITVEVRDVELDEGYVADYPYVVPGPYVLVAVSDDGTGIAPEHLGRVFEPFFTTKDKDKGTGLGLSMVYGFIKQSGGYIQVYSEPGQGTSVKMYLPCAAQAGATAAATPVAAERCGGNETILLVEDDDLVRRYAREQLLSLGYRVLEAASGAEALALAARTGDIDLLLTDMVMPGSMSGHELATAFATVRPGLRVLYCSGYTEDALVHHGRLEPGVRLLGKPYRRADLARAVREILDER